MSPEAWWTALAAACLLLSGPGAVGAGLAQEAAVEAGEQEAAAADDQKKSIAETLEDDSFHYLAAGRRDPFKSLMSLQAKTKDISKLPPIQQLELSQVKITGIVMDEEAGHRAMIRGPGGQAFVVKKGTLIGKNDGEVTEVTLKGIRVVEIYIDFMGRETLKEVFIKTRPDMR